MANQLWHGFYLICINLQGRFIELNKKAAGQATNAEITGRASTTMDQSIALLGIAKGEASPLLRVS